jgi:hypothetical protein
MDAALPWQPPGFKTFILRQICDRLIVGNMHTTGYKSTCFKYAIKYLFSGGSSSTTGSLTVATLTSSLSQTRRCWLACMVASLLGMPNCVEMGCSGVLSKRGRLFLIFRCLFCFYIRNRTFRWIGTTSSS